MNLQKIGTPTTLCELVTFGDRGMRSIVYPFSPSRQGLLVVLRLFVLLGGRGNNRVTEAHPSVQMTQATNNNSIELFSPQWVENFSRHKLGCELGRVSYKWRSSGFGSNINSEYPCGGCWPQRSTPQRVQVWIRTCSSLQRLRKLMCLMHRNPGLRFSEELNWISHTR